jgi:O-antigen ligase
LDFLVIRLYKFHWIINFYLLTWAITRYEINFSRISKFFCFAFLIPNLYAIISTLYGYNWISGEILENTRLVGIVQSATYHAHGNGLILMFFLIILFFQFEHFNRKFKILSILAALLMALSIFLTFTRGIWLSLTITTLGFLLIYNRKLFLAGLVAGLVVMSGLYAFSTDFRQRVHHSIQTKSADQERWNLFNVHVKMFQSSPVLGIGYADNLSHTPSTTWEKFGYDPNFINSHAHNQFLNVLATTGILGFIPFMLFYLWFFVTNIKLIRKYKSENKFEHLVLAMACLATQIEFSLANWTDVGFEYTKIRSLILLVWALVFVMWRGNLKVAPIKK